MASGFARADTEPARPAAATLGTQVAAEVVLFVGAVALYFGIRGITEGRPGVAYRNAEQVMAIERALSLDHERYLQQAIVGSAAVTRLVNWVYIYGHWPVIATVLPWLLIRHRHVFRRVRNAMFASGVIGMVVFATFPVAPPRLSGVGLVDTVTLQSGAYRVLQPPAFTNQFAAMPSLHVGWNLIVGIAVVTVASRLWVRIVGITLPVAMTTAVILTANHFVLDAVAGALLATAAWLAFRGRRDIVAVGRAERHAVGTLAERPGTDRRVAAAGTADLA